MTSRYLLLACFGLLGCLGGNGDHTAPDNTAAPQTDNRDPVGSDPVEGDPVEGDPVEGDPVEGDPVEIAVPPVDIAGMDPSLRQRFEEQRAATTTGTPAQRAEAYGRLGRLAHGFDLLSVAVAAYRNAAASAPEPFRWHYLLARAEQTRGELDAAHRAFEQAVNLAPDELLPRLHLARLQLDQQHLEDAERSFERLFEIEPDHPAGHLGLGRIALAEERFEDAVGHFERALEKAPGASSIHQPLSLAYYRLENAQAGERHAELAGSGRIPISDPWMEQVARERSGVAWWLQKGSQALGRRQYQAAVSAFHRVIEIEPGHKSAHHHLASALARSGELKAAFKAFDKAINLAPNDALIRFDYGTFLGSARQLAKAIEQLREATRLAPDFKEAHHNLGSALARGGALGEAEAAFSKVLALDPRHDRARFARCAVLEELGRTDEAARELRAIVQSDPSHTQARGRLAHLLHATGDHQGAIEQFRDIVNRRPTADAWTNLARLYLWSDRAEQAITAFTQALELTPDHPDARLGEAEALIELGRCAEAGERLAADFEPDSADHQRAAETLRKRLHAACSTPPKNHR